MTNEQYDFLADEAKRERKSMSSIIREWIDRRMHANLKTPIERDSLWEIVGIGRGGRGSASEDHDRYLTSARLRRRPKRR